MGTQGRDIALWLFYIFSFLEIFTPLNMLYPAFLCIFLLGKFYFLERRKAIRYRQVVLAPINPMFAKLLVKRHLRGSFKKSYEVHIMFDKGPLRKQRNNIVADIEEISKQPALYLFETHVGMPMPVKRLIQENGGFLKKGCFLPRPPLAYVKRKSNKLCYGAAIVKEEVNAEKNNYNCGLPTSSSTNDWVNN